MYILQAQQDTFSIPEILCIKLTQNEPSATGIGWEDKNNSDQDQLHKLGMDTKRKSVIALCSKWFQETTWPWCRGHSWSNILYIVHIPGPSEIASSETVCLWGLRHAFLKYLSTDTFLVLGIYSIKWEFL